MDVKKLSPSGQITTVGTAVDATDAAVGGGWGFDLAAGSQGEVYFTHTILFPHTGPVVPGSIQKFDGAGQRSVLTVLSSEPKGISVDAAGNIYYGEMVAGGSNFRMDVKKLSPSGQITTVGTAVDATDAAVGGGWGFDLYGTSKSLVVVTAGWEPGGGSIQEFTLMAEEIKQRLREKQHDLQWDVRFHDWSSLANTGIMPWDAVRAANNAKKEGEKLGKEIIDAGYGTVHLVGHSAGAWLIQSAANYIKQHGANIEVRLTFLDAFATTLISDLSPSKLGENATWVEQYVDHGGPPFTNWALPGAFNVDVTDWAPTGQSGHSWPVAWYGMTTQKPEDVAAHGWGFLQTLEYSGSRPELIGYTDAYGSVWPPEETRHFVGAEAWYVGPPRSLTPITSSDTGTAVATDAKLRLTTESPVWAEVAVTLTESANFILFGYEFLSEAESQLSVFWQGDLVYEVLKSEADAGVNQDIIWTGMDWVPGDYVLKFQLDPLTDEAACVEVSGVQVGAVPEPATLALLALGGLLLVGHRRAARP
jgi:hypothetical protein